MSGTLVSVAVSAGLLLPPSALLQTSATEPGTPPPSAGETRAEPAEDPALTRAEGLYDRGRAKFETVDYLGAIELWTEAYAIVPDSPAAAPIKAALIYNIATAQDRAYNIDHDLAHLRAAAELMERYVMDIPLLYAEEAAAAEERAKANHELEQLRGRIAKAEAEDAPVAAPVQTDPTSPPVDDGPSEDPTAQPLIISGAILVAVGVGGLGLMVGGLSMGNRADTLDSLDPYDLEGRQERFDKGRQGNTLAYVGGIGGGLLLAGGAVLLGLGLKRNRGSNVAVTPAFGPRLAGASLRGRF